MKKIIGLLTMMLVMSHAGATITPPTGTQVYLYAQPSKDAPISEGIDKQEQVRVVSCDSVDEDTTFCLVIHYGVIGWVKKDYVSETPVR
jgi:uncharacterized protein YraI